VAVRGGHLTARMRLLRFARNERLDSRVRGNDTKIGVGLQGNPTYAVVGEDN